MSSKKPGLARAAGLISLATMLSRVFGLVREALFAALMGTSMLAGAFVVAFRIPNLLRDLFAEGALAQAFVPTFKADLTHNGQKSGYELANRLAGTLTVVVGAIVLLGVVFAPYIVDLLASDFRDSAPGKFELTVLLTRVMMPFLLFISLAAVAMGMLNAQDKFTAPSLAPAMFNVASIGVGLSLYAANVQGKWVVIGWSLGTILGGLLQLGVQLPPLWRLGYRPRLGCDLTLRDPRMRRIGRLMLPAIAGLAAVQVNIIVNTMFATTEDGAVVWLNFAFRFLQLPIGVFGVAIATVSTTRYAAAAADSSPDDMLHHLVSGLRLVLFLTVPSTVGLIVLANPIIGLIYEHGAFHRLDTYATAAALRLYVAGLVAYSSVKVLAPAFYAMNRARTTVVASICAVVGNLVINIVFHPLYGYEALAAGTALAAILNFTILYVRFHKKIAKIPHLALTKHLFQVSLASGVMAAAVWGCSLSAVAILGPTDELGLLGRLAGTFGPIVVGVLVYGAGCAVLGIDEVSQYWKKLRRRP